MTRTCSKCKQEKPQEMFFINGKNKVGNPIIRSACRPCQLESNRLWRLKRKQDPTAYYEYVRNETLRIYGMTHEDYTKMLAAQNGGCAICGSTDPKSKRNKHLYVDHDHLTGKVRALLCNRCNNGIGCFEDNPELLVKAVEYLRKQLEFNPSTSARQAALAA